MIKQGGEPEVESVKRTNLASIPAATLDDYFALNAARSRLKAVFQKFWLDNRLDALLYPPAPTTATPFDEWKSISYTALWNLLDYPAVIIPTGRVCESDNADGIENAIFGPEDEQNYSLCKFSHGNPVKSPSGMALLTEQCRYWARALFERAASCTAGRHATGR